MSLRNLKEMIADLASILIVQSIVGPSAFVQSRLKVSIAGNKGSLLETSIKQLRDAVLGTSQSTISRYNSDLISKVGRAKNPRFWKIQPNAGLNVEFVKLNPANAGARGKSRSRGFTIDFLQRQRRLKWNERPAIRHTGMSVCLTRRN